MESNTEVKQEKDGEGADGETEVVSDFLQGCFSPQVGTEVVLEYIKELAGVKIWLELHNNWMFK